MRHDTCHVSCFLCYVFCVMTHVLYVSCYRFGINNENGRLETEKYTDKSTKGKVGRQTDSESDTVREGGGGEEEGRIVWCSLCGG